LYLKFAILMNMKSTPILRSAAAILGLVAAVAVLSPTKADAQCYPETRYHAAPTYYDYGHTRVVSTAPVYYQNAAVYVHSVPRIVHRHPRMIVRHAPRPVYRHVRRPIARHAHHHHRHH